MMVNVAAMTQHDFDTQPVYEVPIQLSLRNGLQSSASLVIETGSSQRKIEHQHSGKQCHHTTQFKLFGSVSATKRR